MLLSRYVFSLAAFGLGLVTAELLDPALPVSFSRRATQQHRRGVRGAFFPPFFSSSLALFLVPC